MLTDEEKAKIEAEEAYRAKLRRKQKPIKTTSFTDKLNKFGFYAALLLAAIVFVLFVLPSILF